VDPDPKAAAMNLPALQATLRQFAAERGWQPFQTPKNLAMALMVEAAELAEIFQWLTPEQSQRAHLDAALKQHIGEEIADVLLYLLQVADHTDCDVPSAVADKLLKNARKYPPTEGAARLSAPPEPAAAEPAAAPAAAPAPAVHLLVDCASVRPTDVALRALVPGLSHVWLFHGPGQQDLARRFASFGERLSLVPVGRAGKAALGLHLSLHIGLLAAAPAPARIVLLSNDPAYASVMTHAQGLGLAVRQLAAPQLAVVARATPARQAAATEPVARSGKPARTAALPLVARRPAISSRRWVAALRSMGGNLPSSQGELMSRLRSLLGPDTSAQQALAALAGLVAAGQVTVDPGGTVSYRL
jgi:NTP pyrophosphatase (non-canonical NTP hydrolase)